MLHVSNIGAMRHACPRAVDVPGRWGPGSCFTAACLLPARARTFSQLLRVPFRVFSHAAFAWQLVFLASRPLRVISPPGPVAVHARVFVHLPAILRRVQYFIVRAITVLIAS